MVGEVFSSGPCPRCGSELIPKADAGEAWCATCQLTDAELALSRPERGSDNPFGKPESCKACTLFLEPGPVWTTGPPGSEILFLGEAPGGEEVDWPQHRPERFKPFVGGSGRLLNSLCAHAGINRKTVRIHNSVLCRPPGNRTPSAAELRECAPFLLSALEDRPNVVIAFGEVALNVITGNKGIGNWRGVPLEGYAGIKVFPTWHPAFIARSQYNWPFAVHDLVRAGAEGAFPELRRVPFDIVVNSGPARDSGALLLAARNRGAATFDFETSGLTPDRAQILMCGVVAEPHTAHVLDWSDRSKQFFQDLLDDPAIKIIGQNILYFDLPFAEAKGISIEKAWPKVFDTMVAFHLCNASYGQTTVAEQKAATFRSRGMEKDLTMIASCHTDIPYWKSRDNYKSDLRRVCGIDCIATDRAATDPANGLMKELETYGMLDLYWKHVLPVHPIIHNMNRLGVKVDEDKAARWAITLEAQALRLEATLREALDAAFLNLDSPKQMMELLYGKMNLPVQYVQDKKGRRPTANAEAMDTLAMQFPEHAGLRLINDRRYCNKMLSTYVMPALQAPDGRLHPRFGVSKAATGRFNSWDPNAQNVPEEMRDMWIPDSDEHVLLSADWSQIEWRLAMVLSGDPVGLQLLASGVDNHRAVAAETLRKPLEDVTDEERYASKFIVYGLGYGRGAESIAKGHGLPMDFVQDFMRGFFGRFRVFAGWREDNVRFAKLNHYLVNAFKRRRWWYTYQVTEQYNYPQQSNAADMMYDALIEIDRELPKGATLRLTVHDEVVLNVPKDVLRETWRCVRDNMQKVQRQICEASAAEDVVRSFYPEGWFCPADIHIGSNWAMTKSKDLEQKAARALLERELGVASF